MSGRTAEDILSEMMGTLLGKQSFSLVDAAGRPNLLPAALRLRNIDVMALNIKFFGYELARSLAETLPTRTDLAARHVGLKSKPSTQADIESDWVAYWCAQLKVPVIFHRKLWELCYVLQALHDDGQIRAGARGLGFGCGQEPLPSYLASAGAMITVTDLPSDEMQSAGWAATNQHSSSLELMFKDYLVSKDVFDRNVNLRHVDMNSIPPDLSDYDFCWSVCAFEHLGSIQNGLDFVQNSLRALRPGGVAVHTTEFNFSNDAETIDNWPTVLFQRKHFQQLAALLQAQGHTVSELDFDVGGKPMDRFIDLPPFRHEFCEPLGSQWVGQEAHIKLSMDGFPTTCFGLIVKKAE